MNPNDANSDDLSRGLEAAFSPADDDAAKPSAIDRTLSVVNQLSQKLGTTSQFQLIAHGEEPPIAKKSVDDVGAPSPTVGHYEVHGKIAQGGMGVVVKGRDADLGREVAIKFLKSEHRESQSMVQRFVDEAQIGGQLQHPGILPVYELGLDAEGCPFFAMKLIHGKTLQEVLAESDTVKDRQRLIGLMEQVCHAVAYAHARRVIHRDLKPSNVMIGHFGEVQVVDWGLAKVLSTDEISESELTSETTNVKQSGDTVATYEEQVTTARSASDVELSTVGTALGTPLYMAPEQARGELERLDRQTDVFALGAMLCEVVTGQPVYEGDRIEVIQSATEARTGPALARLGKADVEQELQTIIRRCLALEPADRFRDAGVLAAELDKYSNSVGERAQKAEITAARAEAKAKAERRARNLTTALAIVVISAIVTGGAVFWQIQQARQDRLNRGTQSVETALNNAAQSLGEAVAADYGVREPWTRLATATENLRATLENAEVQTETKSRSQDLLKQIEPARRNREFLDRIDQIVIDRLPDGGSNWKRMEQDMRKAFADYGLDLDDDDPTQIQKAITESKMSVELTHALDLWVRARFVVFRDGKIFSHWLPLIYATDPDPDRVSIRKLTFAQEVNLDDVRKIEDRLDPAEADAITYHYLLGVHSRVPNSTAWLPVLKRAQFLFPDDFMFYYIEGTTSLEMEKYDQAVQALRTAASLRPKAGGVWQWLGFAHLSSGDAEEAIPALRRALEIEESNITIVHLANALEATGEVEQARKLFGKAMQMGDDYPNGFRDYGSFLTRRGEFEEGATWLQKQVDTLRQIEDELKASQHVSDFEIDAARTHRQAAEQQLQKCKRQEALTSPYQKLKTKKEN